MNGAQISRIAIWAALLATLYLAFESSGQSEDDLVVSVPVRTTPRTSVAEVGESQAASALPLRHWNEEAANDPFQRRLPTIPSRR
jgi:hypothetical protein